MKVVHCKKEPFDVYVGRPTKWGNPFVIGKDGDREDVIKKYRNWILGQPDLLRDIGELAGKTLACWCAPNACHADVLLLLANNPENIASLFDGDESYVEIELPEGFFDKVLEENHIDVVNGRVCE